MRGTKERSGNLKPAGKSRTTGKTTTGKGMQMTGVKSIHSTSGHGSTTSSRKGGSRG